jgi:hypothetical protein
VQSENLNFVFTGGECWSCENKSMRIIGRGARLLHIRSRLVRDPLLDEVVVYKELHFNAPGGIAVVNGPSGNRLGISMVQPPAHRGGSRSQKQAGRNCCDQ